MRSLMVGALVTVALVLGAVAAGMVIVVFSTPPEWADVDDTVAVD